MALFQLTQKPSPTYSEFICNSARGTLRILILPDDTKCHGENVRAGNDGGVTMRKFPAGTSLLLTFAFAAITANAIIVRHDVDDARFLKFGEQFRRSICNLNVNPKVPDCMATFLNRRWIITAAHCAVLIDAKLKKGEAHDIDFLGAHFAVEKVVLHPQYETTRSVQDVALVKLRADVRDIRSIPILTEPLVMNEPIFLAGYGDKGTGKTGPDGNDAKLRGGTNRIDSVSNEWVRFLFDTTDSVNATELEAISGPGDSGGPIFVKRGKKYLLIGISSRQSTRATNGKEGLYGVTEFYTRVSTYQDWIDKTLTGPK